MRGVLIVLLVGVVAGGLIVSAAGLSVDSGSIGDIVTEGNQQESAAAGASGSGATVAAAENDTNIELVEFGDESGQSPSQDDDDTPQSKHEAAEEGAEKGIELAQEQGINVTQEQRLAAKSAASEAVEQHQEATVEQVQHAATGAVHGALLQHQTVTETQFQSAVIGSTSGALSQHQTANVTQLQNAAWGASHGALDQHQEVTVEQIQHAARGAAGGAAHEAGKKGIGHVGTIQEASQGAAHGALEGAKKQKHAPQHHVAQHQEITVEQVQHAAAGAASGVLDGVVEQRQTVTVEQQQHVTIKQVQTAAMGAAEGALVQKQQVTVEQTQVAARGAGKGALSITQIQQVTITQIQKAALGAATGAIYQSQEATIEQIQAAAVGAATGSLVQIQAVHVTQVQYAARGAATGAVESAVQHQVVDVTQIQAASRGAGTGAVKQSQTVNVHQVQTIARGASKGALSVTQEQRVTVVQIQMAAEATCAAVATAVQNQRVTVEQVQRITENTAADTVRQSAADGLEGEAEVRERASVHAVDRTAEEEPIDGDATVRTADQTIDGETVTIDDVTLSEGGFVAIHDAGWLEGERVDSVIGVSDYLEPGEHDSVTVTLFADVPGTEFETDALEAGSHTLFAVPYQDADGDGQFDSVDTDGDQNPQYVRAGGEPIAASFDVTVVEERTATLDIDDLTGDGESLTIENATANVEFYVEARADDQIVQSERFEANATTTSLTLDLETPLEEDANVDVSIRAAEDGEALSTATVEYEVEVGDEDEVDDEVEIEDEDEIDEILDPTAELEVADQSGDGETVTVDRATANVEYYLEAHYDDETVRSDAFEADESVENLTLDLDPSLEEDAEIEIAVRAAEDDAEIAVSGIEYTVDTPVTFLDCTTIEIQDATAFEGLSLQISHLEGPWVDTPTLLTDDDLAETVDEPIEDGTVLSTTDLYPYSEFTHYVEFVHLSQTGEQPDELEAGDENVLENPNPATIEDCQELGFGERPTAELTFVDQESDGTNATIDDVTLSEGGFVALYEADAPIEDESVLGVSDYLEPGSHEDVTVALEEPIDEDRTLVAVVHRDLTGDEQFAFESLDAVGVHDGPYLDANGDPVADGAELTLAPAFAVSIVDARETVEPDQPIELVVDVENLGAGSGESPVVLDVGPQEAAVTEDVSLGPGEATTLTMTVDPPQDVVGIIDLTVRIADPDVAAPEAGSDSVTITVDEPGEPAFEVTGIDAPATVEAGASFDIVADVTNTGEAAGEGEVVFDVGDFADAATDVVSLSPGETATLVVTVQTGPDDVGDLEVTVRTADTQASTAVEVAEPVGDQQDARAQPATGIVH
ncbi:DUF7282 domain-containing protein [Natronosalvus vescus]|uniref:DUF7282 domain-containing protein n=1 Tax=Natronosalvus vescus TaxID=2953881 RepID=UPI0020917A4F|nr:hypothetical protein [Natronosalvus vescus]